MPKLMAETDGRYQTKILQKFIITQGWLQKSPAFPLIEPKY